MPNLSAQHRQALHEQGLCDAIIDRRGYDTITPDSLARGQWQKTLDAFRQPGAGLFIPRFTRAQVEGNEQPLNRLAQIRLDEPHTQNGKTQKYTAPPGRSSRQIDYLQWDSGPEALAGHVLLLVEGVKDGDGALSLLRREGIEDVRVVRLPDCAGAISRGRKVLLKEVEEVASAFEEVWLVPDADCRTNTQVWKATDLTLMLLQEVATAYLVVLPLAGDDDKRGFGDLVGAGLSFEEITRNRREVMIDPPEGTKKRDRGLAAQAKAELEALYSDSRMARAVVQGWEEQRGTERVQRCPDAFGDRLRFAQQVGPPRLWNGARLAPLSPPQLTHEVSQRLEQIARTMGVGQAKLKDLTPEEMRQVQVAVQRCQSTLEGTAKARSVIGLLEGNPSLFYDDQTMQVPDTLLPCPNGQTLDLGTLQYQDTDPATAFFCAGVVPQQGETPHWDAFLDSISTQHKWLGQAVEATMGWALQGTRHRQALTFLRGLGRNGKGLIMAVARQVFGGFYVSCSPGTFFEDGRRYDRHDHHLLNYRGRRLLDVADPSGQFKASFALSYSGGDTIVAEQKGGDTLEFNPTAAAMLHGQTERIRLTERDNALLGRLRVLEFTESFVGREDEQLQKKLLDEAPAIAWRWAVVAHDYLASGQLAGEEQMRDASGALVDELDVVGQWLGECCQPDPAGEIRITPTDLYAHFREWNEKNGHPRMSQTKFGTQLKQPRPGWDIELGRSNMGGRAYEGLALVHNTIE